MEIANIHEAKSRRSRLVEQAMNGEEVIIARAGRPMVRLVPIRPDDSPREGGQWKGRVKIADDFDTSPDDLAATFGVDPPCRCCSTPTSSSGDSTTRSSSPKPPATPSPTVRTLFTSAPS